MQNNNITRIDLDDKEFILIGTAHVSKQSAEQVKEVIESEKPDAVCIELDEQRYHSIIDKSQWRKMDIFKIIKQKKSTFLFISLVISSFQKRMAKQLGIQVGAEMIQGIDSAKETGAALVLADRDIQITFSRIWHGISLWGKLKLLMQILLSIFSDEKLTEEELENLKSQDTLNAMLSDFTKVFPRLKTPLIDERDQYLAQKIKEAPGKKVVAVLGAAHVPGIQKEILKNHDLTALARRPKKSIFPKVIAWSIPVIILGMIIYTFFVNYNAGVQQTISWVLWNGSFSAIGAMIALGHPLSIITAFAVAPLSSLNPLIAAGWFAGIVEAYMRKPNVEDFENLATDVFTLKLFWKNKVTRVLLIVMLSNIGSTVGTIVGGSEVIRLFLNNLPF